MSALGTSAAESAPTPAIVAAPPSRRRQTLRGVLVPIGVLVLWEVLARAGALPEYLVAPTLILASIWELAVSGDLWVNLADSLLRSFAGFVLGVGFGVLIGLLAGVSRKVETFFDPLVSLTYPVPKIALLPLLLVWFGLGHWSKIFIIMMAVWYPAFINAYYGAKSVNKLYVWSARNMGATRWQVFWKIIVPASLPQVLTGVRVGLALSFVVLFASEMIGSRTGLGFMIKYAEANIRFDIMFAAILLIGTLGFLSDRALVWVRRRLLVGQSIREEAGA